jgi:hypothetical protein
VEQSIMGFRRSDLQEAFFVPGMNGFRVWGYGTTDPLEEVLRQDYFAAARSLLRPGELIYVSIYPRPQTDRSEQDATRVALVMVRDGKRGTASVRLVQDFGGPADPSAPLGVPAVKRGRGRPPGSRTKKPHDSVPHMVDSRNS